MSEALDTAAPISRLPEGVYFGLPEKAYHADAALGSGDMRKLSVSPPNFWFDSRFNPQREPENDDSEERIVGRAMHAAVLEGREALDARFHVKRLNWSTKEGKAEKEAVERLGKAPISEAFYARSLLAGAMVRNNPYLGGAFDGALGTEVSIFWEKDGIPKKGRLDGLKPRAIVDLKSIRNRDDMEFVALCRRHIAAYRYDIQVKHYLEGASHIRRFAAEGKVFGLSPEETERMRERLLEELYPAAAFVFVFVQKALAPLTWGCSISPANPILEVAGVSITTAEENWRTYVEKFGLATPWVEAHPLEELDMDDLPGWFGR